MKTTILSSTIKVVPLSTASLDNPYINIVDFILTDDKPNANGVGIHREDFISFAQSAVFMPIKMTEGSIEDHPGSKPIGAITQTEVAEDIVRGKGVLWPEERPADVALIKDKTSRGEAQISWEISYEEDTIDAEGIVWLGNPKLLAATLVKYPAYDGRTPITNFASTSEISGENMTEEVVTPTEQLPVESVVVETETPTETVPEENELDIIKHELEELRKFKLFTERGKVVTELLGELPKKDLEELIGLTDNQLKVVKRLIASKKQEASAIIPNIPVIEDNSASSVLKKALEMHIGGR
jgi:hypothetical protein